MSGSGPVFSKASACFLSLDLSAIELSPDAGLAVRHIIVQADRLREYARAPRDATLRRL